MRHVKDMRVLRAKMLDRLDRVDRENAQRAQRMDKPSEDVTDFEMMAAMQAYGGGFFSVIARAWMVGDEQNRAKILATWPEEVERYRELAKLKREQARTP
jgi:hypothetical protein